MANIFAERIKSVNLTKKQKVIAEYFIKNQERIGNLSSLEIANEIGVCDASIIRFSRAIGYDGFADLKEHVYDMLMENSLSNASLTERMKRNEEKFGSGNITEQFMNVMNQNLDTVFNNNEQSSFEEVVGSLIKAKKRYVIGMRGCKGVATSFGRLLAFMMPQVKIIIDTECTSISSLQDVEENDAVVIFVFSRFYKIDVNYLRIAKTRGAVISLITDDITGPLNNYCDHIILAPAESMNFFHSSVGVTLISEYLLTLLGKKIDFKNRIEENDRATEYQRL